MKNLIKIAKKISILVLVVSLFGCTDDDDNKYPVLEAGFTYTINIDTGTVTFINISSQATNYSWDFGDETSSNLINPVKTYPNGTYTVVLKATNVAGASDTFEDTITILIPEKATLPISFDGENTSYDAVTFGGAAFELVDNPDPSGANPTVTKVGAITNIGAAFEGFYFDLGAPINLTTNKSISMNFWSDAPISVLLKLEEGTGGAIEATASHGGTGWETIIFNFGSSNSYSRLTMFVDGPGTTAGTFYVDNITQIETPPAPCTTDLTQSLLAADFNLTFLTDPTSSIVEDGGDFEWITNPDFDNALNTSCKVGKVTRNASLQYANNQINFTTPFDFSTKSGFKIKVWSAAIGTKVTVKLEGGVVTQVTKTTTKANEWEELTFDFADSVTGNNKIVLFFNIDSFTTGTFYFDDFKLYGTGSGGGGACTSEVAESLNAADFNLTFQTNNVVVISDGSSYERTANPKVDAINGSCFTGKVVNLGINPWDNVQINLATKLDFNANAGFKIKVFSPKAGTKVTMKLEEIGAAGNNSGDVPAVRTQTNAWEELTFPFPESQTGKFNKIVIFFDLENKDTDTYYFDDLKLYARSGGGGGGGGTGDCPAPPTGELLSNGDFEAGAVCWQFFAGTSISTTVSNGGSNSAEMQGATGVAVNFKQERFAIGVVQPNTSYTVSFDIIANGPFGDGGVFKAFAFSEGVDGGSVPATLHTLTDNTTSLATTWERKTYTFTTAANANQVEGGLSFLLEIVNSTAKLNVDNVVIKKTP